jgi:hypothetical protein
MIVWDRWFNHRTLTTLQSKVKDFWSAFGSRVISSLLGLANAMATS